VDGDVRLCGTGVVKTNVINRRLRTAWGCVCVSVCVCVDEQGDGPLRTCGKMRAPKQVTDRAGR
jgi:hypothetical protein